MACWRPVLPPRGKGSISASVLFSPVRLCSGNVKTARELLQLTPVYQQVENGWTQAEVVDLPGVITAAPSREEAQEMLLEVESTDVVYEGPWRPACREGLGAATA